MVGGAFDGQELTEVLRTHPEYLGKRHKGENALPILIKFVDAKKNLSVQPRCCSASMDVGMIFFDDSSITFYKRDCIFVPAESVILAIHGQT